MIKLREKENKINYKVSMKNINLFRKFQQRCQAENSDVSSKIEKFMRKYMDGDID